ncbi:coenzyme F420-0:L-glutamate ligase [Phyllobacterium sp. YR531]|uniref:coenzyme F420-0:L-glutamate ligase n=1 Tax=Phyllobacterium sp. YR531 TaxID=1144343 RepID=UPI00026FB1F7|nr:coenzyme F420-0:L-glutamate ligase [Phyllobacterium sp. YR531]EJN05832.1 gamma-glutamyl ligase [Phyllobacterium sp. YR531]
MISILPVTGLPEILPGDDVGFLLCNAMREQNIQFDKDDILVVTQKIVSKAEGRHVALGSVEPGVEARKLAELTRKDARLVELVLRQTETVVRAVPHVLIVRTRLGHVMANAGIDQSNVGTSATDRVLLLPLDPDASAKRLSEQLGCGVIISDSFGRPWRCGVTAVAIGAAGFPALLDRRGERDRDGRTLESTIVAIGDLIASSAALVTGEGSEGIPAALVRGYRAAGEQNSASSLIRPREQDLFL